MTPSQRANLAQSIKRAIADIRPEEITMFAVMVMSNSSLKQLIITEITKYLQNELNLAIA